MAVLSTFTAFFFVYQSGFQSKWCMFHKAHNAGGTKDIYTLALSAVA